MIGLDTNILIRYLTKDDEQQWQQAKQLIESGQQCFVANIVLCEIVWVLKGETYRYSKQEIVNTLEAMLTCGIFEFENRSAFYMALQRTKQGKADFSDYLIGALSLQAGAVHTVTFDCKLNNENGFHCL
ncbi:PIN domain-containing protein [Aphanothece sacrum]|uniref:Twitching motility protein PilT n=1 Tax=Aphanothece sacrum FPU1 TaxID=1920663 RepID=A0A401IKL0_APHSA|nr:type II toxin-antitoxin system VapC family toxin [Aphanothece sacrum]GBF81817.1 twitching motility protein PilT [Aphanothece sacrum FPU1]GBF84349.1 twitching motility protein [Aphanothece sacrum FPU3]